MIHTPRASARAATFVLVLAGAFAVRLLCGDLPTDHFVSATRAFNVFDGDWPVRDFEDPRTPLMTFLSAAAMGSLALGIMTAVLQVAATPRLYGYPKLLAPAAATWLFFRFARFARYADS